MREFIRDRPIFSWALYDWANSAFATTVMAGFFPLFFQKFWSVGVDASETTARLAFANVWAGLFIAILAPVLGAIADRGARRKQFLFAWTLLGVAASAGLCFVGKGDWNTAAVLFILGTMGFNGGVVFNDALLLDVASPEQLDRASAFGYGLGYLGGGLLFLVNAVMYLKPAWFGIPDAPTAVQISFLTVAVWWLLFTFPLMRNVRERQRGEPVPLWQAVRAGFSELAGTITHARQHRVVLWFLVAYWFYIDGVNTIIKMAVDFGLAIGLEAGGLLVALLVTQFVAFPASLFFGWLGDRIGPKQGILIGLAVYAGISIYANFITTSKEFFAMAVAVGLVQGGVQSLSRSLFGRLIPEGKNAEYFGFYNMMGKFATVFGPLLVGIVASVTHDTRLANASIVVLFLLGGALLLRVPVTPRGA
jgi:MFS transporter, UMF1 family